MGKLEILKTVSSAFAAVVIPLVLLFVGQSYTSAIKERELQGRFVELAVTILREEPTKINHNLRKWATQIIDSYSGVRLTAETKDDLINRTIIPASTEIRAEGKVMYSIDSETGEKMYVGRLHRKGLYRVGLQEPETFIGNHREKLLELKLTDSEINVIIATSENLGNLDAVNTWDNQFISFGLLQWTAGSPGKPGELPALINIIKKRFPDVFNHYWGQFGLDVVDVDSKTGWFSYHGKKLTSAADKAMLREHIWADRFAKAGADIKVQAVQILHAVNRINLFYFVKSPKLNGYALADLITSEYGVALLLDNHVNRPGYVRGCVSKALERSNLSDEEMIHGGDKVEKLLIKNYLDIRQTYGKYPMTDAMQRASVTRGYVMDRIISDSRGSFVTGLSTR